LVWLEKDKNLLKTPVRLLQFPGVAVAVRPRRWSWR
jgi:hypothetical protein